MHSAKILADSISSRGHRLTTFEVKMPRIVLAEYNTHGMVRRNSASSRAIPVVKMLRMVQDDPYVPREWGRNQKGMQADEIVSPALAARSEKEWLKARDSAVKHVEELLALGIHKQLTNRLLEPFMWHTIITSATDYSNFFNLCNNPAAHPDIRIPAGMMQNHYESFQPEELEDDEWHLPLMRGDEELEGLEGLEVGDSIKVSVGRCARVSYLTHDGIRNVKADIELYGRLMGSGHLSPAEHVARPMDEDEYEILFKQRRVVWVHDIEEEAIGHWETAAGEDDPESWSHYCGPYNGWVQHRKMINGEEDYGKVLKERAS